MSLWVICKYGKSETDKVTKIWNLTSYSAFRKIERKFAISQINNFCVFYKLQLFYILSLRNEICFVLFSWFRWQFFFRIEFISELSFCLISVIFTLRSTSPFAVARQQLRLPWGVPADHALDPARWQNRWTGEPSWLSFKGILNTIPWGGRYSWGGKEKRNIASKTWSVLKPFVFGVLIMF